MATGQQLALDGGTPVRTGSFPTWPVYGELEEQALLGLYTAASGASAAS